MDSSELYHTKQQFFLGAYTSLVSSPLPEADSADYTPTLLYVARAHLALNSPSAALELVNSHPDQDNLSVKALRALVNYVQNPDDSVLEELRDLTVEVESGDEDEKLKGVVKVLAGTALVRAGEVEEAVDTLGADTQDLEVVLILVQIYLSISRPDLAIKLFNSANKWAEDDLLLQLIESTISLYSPPASLAANKNNNFTYRNAESFFTEQLANPSLSSPHLLKSRGVARILLGEFKAAKSDLEEAIDQGKDVEDAETKAAYAVATSLSGDNSDELWTELETKYPEHPLVVDVAQKSDLFDELVNTKWPAPPLATSVA